MPTNKLWIEHTERAAWDSVEALRERLLKAESRLQALATGVDRVPQLLDLWTKPSKGMRRSRPKSPVRLRCLARAWTRTTWTSRHADG